MTIHTPPPKKTTAVDNMVQVEIREKLKEQISNSVKLSRLLQTLNTFVNPRNLRAGFVFHLEPGEVLNLYKQKSPLSYQITGILKHTRAPQLKVSLLEALQLIIQALNTLIQNQEIINSKGHGTAVLKDAVRTTSVNSDLLHLVTGLNEPPLDGFLKKTVVLFEELLSVGILLQEAIDNWHEIRRSLINLLKEPVSDNPDTATRTFHSILAHLCLLTEKITKIPKQFGKS